ncbi:hypothetical protein L1887_49909 [Cichorium endivia]|nr:hypothetical protein L1887_49909 [Cichorium endivia]
MFASGSETACRGRPNEVVGNSGARCVLSQVIMSGEAAGDEGGDGDDLTCNATGFGQAETCTSAAACLANTRSASLASSDGLSRRSEHPSECPICFMRDAPMAESRTP